MQGPSQKIFLGTVNFGEFPLDLGLFYAFSGFNNRTGFSSGYEPGNRPSHKKIPDGVKTACAA